MPSALGYGGLGMASQFMFVLFTIVSVLKYTRIVAVNVLCILIFLRYIIFDAVNTTCVTRFITIK